MARFEDRSALDGRQTTLPGRDSALVLRMQDIMSEQRIERRGVFDGSARVLRELLASPRWRQTIRILLNELDPQNAHRLVAVLFEVDPELALSAAASAPKLCNAMIDGGAELLGRMADFQPDLLREFFNQLVDQIDLRGLGRLTGLYLILAARIAAPREINNKDEQGVRTDGFAEGLSEVLVQREAKLDVLLPQLADTLINAADRAARTLAADVKREDSTTVKTVETLTSGIRRVAADNPDFIERVLRPLALAMSDAVGTEGSDNG
ncbi:MAG: hypothetical protein P9M14_17120 [Candidatus Alcyoniella australis]|nr:hypothetical protein [Candidatus Alcyoniella australis]